MISIFHCLIASRTTTSLITRISWETTLIPGAIAQKSTDSRRANNASSSRWLHDRLSNEFASVSSSLSLQHQQPARHYERFTSDGGIFFPRQYPHLPRSLIYDNYLVTFEGSPLAGENRSFAVMPLRRFFIAFFFYYVRLSSTVFSMMSLRFVAFTKVTRYFRMLFDVTYVRRKEESLWCTIQLIRSREYLACRYAVTSLAMVKEQIKRDPVGAQVISCWNFCRIFNVPSALRNYIKITVAGTARNDSNFGKSDTFMQFQFFNGNFAVNLDDTWAALTWR